MVNACELAPVAPQIQTPHGATAAASQSAALSSTITHPTLEVGKKRAAESDMFPMVFFIAFYLLFLFISHSLVFRTNI